MAEAVRIRVSAPSYRFVYGKRELRKTLRQAGQEVAQTARRLIRESPASGRTYYGTGGAAYRGGYRKGRYTASAPGEAPRSVTGTLLRSIKVRPFRSGDGVAIRDAAFYALFLQAGAVGGGRKKGIKGRKGADTGRRLDPRPFLTTALALRQGNLTPRLEAAVQRDIQFVRQRG